MFMKEEFSGQRDGEQVILVFRRHPITMSKGIFVFVLLSLIGFAPYAIMPSNEQLLFIAVTGVLVGIFVFFYHWISWYFSIYILTNQRVRQNIQRGLFHKSVLDLDLDKIMSVYIDVHGFLASIFKFGTIIIHTQVGDMRIKKIASVESVYDKIQEEIAKVG